MAKPNFRQGADRMNDLKTSLYRHYDKHGTLLYVGISLSALNRLIQHNDNSKWAAEIASVKIEHFDTRSDALEAERAAIYDEKPLYNIHRPPPKKADAMELMQARSRAYLSSRVVQFLPMYTLSEAAATLRVTPRIVNRLISERKLDFVEVMRKTNTEIMVTGWQLLDYMETLQAACESKAPLRVVHKNPSAERLASPNCAQEG